MFKKLSAVVLALALVILTGCAGETPAASTAVTTRPANVDIIEEAHISSYWTVMQVRINLESGIPLLLTLAPGDKVDGYFFLEKGDSVNFQVSGKSMIYQSTPQSTGSANITSDRFSFTASDAQGIAYTLNFSPVEKKNAKTVTPVIYLEVIFPSSGTIYNPMDTK